MKKLPLAFNLLFVLLLAAPMLQRVSRLFPVTTLYGAEQRSPTPRIEPRAWFDGAFQKRFERAFEARIGFRGQLVKTYNQLNYSIFGQTSGKRGSQVPGDRVCKDLPPPRPRRSPGLGEARHGSAAASGRTGKARHRFLPADQSQQARDLPRAPARGNAVPPRRGTTDEP
jgi:hypothetical protein